ncbi:hypothetical protein AVEN_34331-1 [Araneus ventricosus]|uniref:Uncharacterized protein n=1 Tax=Araneus ventricosus TaxID=182803 RepID=A0A4Y2G307_ARAVE|nr:hypothetical protein AVEN_34331-1 [Araneus ventricosus]
MILQLTVPSACSKHWGPREYSSTSLAITSSTQTNLASYPGRVPQTPSFNLRLGLPKQGKKENIVCSLDNRKVFLNYDDSSTTKHYPIGCPQGSNSGPLYWLLVANEALNLEFKEDVRLLAYADDFYLFVKATGKQTNSYQSTRTTGSLEQTGKNFLCPRKNRAHPV